MKKVTEIKHGRTSWFRVETFSDGNLVESKNISINVGVIVKDGKIYYTLCDSNKNKIEPAYMFLNNDKLCVYGMRHAEATCSLRYLFIFCEIINKSYDELNRDDFNKLRYFLRGTSAGDNKMEMKLFTIRKENTVNNMFCYYRAFYRDMGISIDMG